MRFPNSRLLIALLPLLLLVSGCEAHSLCAVRIEEFRIVPLDPIVVDVGQTTKLKGEVTWCAATQSRDVTLRWQLQEPSYAAYLTVKENGEVTGVSPHAAVPVNYYREGETTPFGYALVKVR